MPESSILPLTSAERAVDQTASKCWPLGFAKSEPYKEIAFRVRDGVHVSAHHEVTNPSPLSMITGRGQTLDQGGRLPQRWEEGMLTVRRQERVSEASFAPSPSKALWPTFLWADMYSNCSRCPLGQCNPFAPGSGRWLVLLLLLLANQ